MQLHRAEFHLGKHHANHQHDHENGVKVVRNGTDKQVHAVLAVYKAANSSSPRRNRRDDAHRRSRCINQKCQLGTRYIVSVCHRTHDAANRQTVEVVINKDEDAQQNRRQLRADLGFDV